MDPAHEMDEIESMEIPIYGTLGLHTLQPRKVLWKKHFSLIALSGWCSGGGG